MKTYTYEDLHIDHLASADLYDEAHALFNADEPCQAYLVTIYDEDGRALVERAEALFFPDAGRLGIAWGAEATWADSYHLENGIEMWLNDPEAWANAH